MTFRVHGWRGVLVARVLGEADLMWRSAQRRLSWLKADTCGHKKYQFSALQAWAACSRRVKKKKKKYEKLLRAKRAQKVEVKRDVAIWVFFFLSSKYFCLPTQKIEKKIVLHQILWIEREE